MKDKFTNVTKILLIFSLIISLNANEKAGMKTNDLVNETALHDAVRAKDLDLIKYLIKQGITVNTQDSYGYTSLHLAVRLHDLNITKYLLNNGATPNIYDVYKDTPLIDSTRNNDTQISVELICHGADRNVRDSNGMSTLHNSAKNKNKIITNLLRADNLKPYCQKELEVSIDDLINKPSNKNKLCGTITKGYATEVKVEFNNEDDELFGPFDTEFNNETKRWCLNVEDTSLLDGKYDIKVIAKDYVVNIATDTMEDYNKRPYLTASFDDQNETNSSSPQICGKTNSESIDNVTLLIHGENEDYGKYSAVVNDDQTWCADVTDKIPNGEYKLEGEASVLPDQHILFYKDPYTINANEQDNTDLVNSSTVTSVEIPGLYEALMNEFENDFDKWDAELNKSTLTFRFKNPKYLFEKGSRNLKPKFKSILDDFFPRYVSIVKEYRDSIKNIIIEGHSSSEHGGAKTTKGKYKLNQILSQKRANTVLKYSNMILSDNVVNNIIWIVTTFKAEGLSSSQLIYNKDETENKELSRRVDYRIVTNKSNLKGD